MYGLEAERQEVSAEVEEVISVYVRWVPVVEVKDVDGRVFDSLHLDPVPFAILLKLARQCLAHFQILQQQTD